MVLQGKTINKKNHGRFLRLKKIRTIHLVRAAVIAAVYASLTLVLQPISLGPIQCRFAECLTILPLLFPEAIPGVALGCLFSNIIGSGNIYDIVLGTLATSLAAFITYKSKRIYLGIVPPILINALIVPVILLAGYGEEGAYVFFLMTVLVGQTIAVAGFGIPLYYGIRKIWPEFAFMYAKKNPAELPQDEETTKE
jgi:uncharacterized membrane protein